MIGIKHSFDSISIRVKLSTEESIINELISKIRCQFKLRLPDLLQLETAGFKSNEHSAKK